MQGKTARCVESEHGAPTACCAMCGSAALIWDEVPGEQNLRLGECLHCEYRWTRPGGVAPFGISVAEPVVASEETGLPSKVSNAA